MGCTSHRKPSNHSEQVSPKSQISKTWFVKSHLSDLNPNYTIFKKIGSGGNSEVYLAQQSLSGQFVALKALKTHLSEADSKEIQQNSIETEILKTLDHPNIIKCFENFESNSQLFITLEYIDGGSLRSYLNSQSSALPLDQAALIMSSLLKAVCYCHEQGVIHRDVKLDNLFIQFSPSLSVKLGDFGSAVLKQDKDKAQYVGTLTYLAPEVLLGEYDEKVDVWACGIVLYALITGHSPYTETDRKAIRQRIRKADLGLKELSLPHDLLDFLEQMLNPDPGLRVSAAEALKHPWLSSAQAGKTIKQKMIQKAWKNPKLNEFQSAVSLFINSMLNWNQEMEEVNTCFESIDSDCNGKIDASEFFRVAENQFGVKRAKKMTKKFFERFDLNRNGVIEYSEFINALSRSSQVLKDENLEKVYRIIACECKGKICKQEIEHFFGIKINENCFDDGFISVNEFKTKVHLKENIVCL